MAQFEILTHLGYPLHVYTVRLAFGRTTRNTFSKHSYHRAI